MPALFFPNLDALRLVLASGAVPPEVARTPARAGFDAHGRLWLEPAEAPPREALAAMARLGVRAHGDGGVPTEPVGCWAELLSLRPAPPRPASTVLFELPDGLLARFVAEVRRLTRGPVGVRLLPSETGRGTAWVTVVAPPAGLLLRWEDPDSPVEPFAEQAAGVWVRVGWEHPLAEHLAVADRSLLFLRPPRSVAVHPGPVPAPTSDELRLPPRPAPKLPGRVPASVPVALRLGRASRTPREALWVFDGPRVAEFWDFCRTADESLVRRFEVATIAAGDQERILLRCPAGKKTVVPPVSAAGYYPDPRAAGLYVPAGTALRPTVRVKELTRLLDLGPDRVVWVEPGPDGVAVPHAAPVVAFHPLAESVVYEPPEPVRLSGAASRSEPFPLPWPVLGEERPEPADPEPPPAPPHPPAREPDTSAGPGWLARLARRFRRQQREAVEEAGSGPVPSPPERRPAPKERVHRKLASADALLHGQARAARRHELEARLLADFPRLGPDDRAARWAELASVYGATGKPHDAAVCWVNAIWESDPPPPGWLEQWFLCECRAAKLPPTARPDRWLSEPGRFESARVLAGYCTAAAHLAPPSELAADLPRVLAFLDAHADALPVRAAWLARFALTRLCDGDALGLARWRDRLLGRLRDRGPGLDLDSPSFLRFHGTASADRFQTAKDWLARVGEKIHEWVKKLGTGGRLQWAGIDAETDATAEYARLMLAWGLGCLGEWTRSRNWAALARKALSRSAAGTDGAAHALLADLFTHRIRDAQEGRPAKPGLPDELRERFDRLGYLARYAVDQFRDHSRILEPAGRRRAYRGLDVRPFRGSDLLGERLHVLADRTDPAAIADEARQLLAVCAADPSPATVPRVALTLLDLAPQIEEPLVPGVLALLPPALDWMEAAVQAGPWPEEERAERFPRYQARLLEAGFAAAAWFGQWSAVAPAVGYLSRRVAAGQQDLRRALELAAGSVFRSFRKLGFRAEAEGLLRALDPGPGVSLADEFPPSRLGLAVGWFAVGDEDAGNRILNEARERLFLAGADERERTELATAYAEALGFAPPGIALGRLEEIFQRLDRVSVKGSTNRYFTLKPLELIDAVVRSVVTEDFALGPAVRGWLADDEFLIRRRIHRDLTAVLREQGIG
jgi:hypothetical protein